MRDFAALMLVIVLSLHSYAQSERYIEHIAKETDIDMILVRGGTFEMGSNDQAQSQPIHSVSLNSFYIGKYEVTQQQWDAAMGDYYNLSHHSNCALCPVELVSWAEAEKFTRKISEMTGKSYRLPTEAEWEYAAKGGQGSKHYLYSGSNNPYIVGWVWEELVTDMIKTRHVGLKQPNELGIYDMTGNVMEWCSDWYDSTYYQQGAGDNPRGAATGRMKVLRGGSYMDDPQAASVTWREMRCKPGNDRGQTMGFRIVRDYDKSAAPAVPERINKNK